MALMFVTGRTTVHSLIANTLTTAPPTPPVFEDDFDMAATAATGKEPS